MQDGVCYVCNFLEYMYLIINQARRLICVFEINGWMFL